ncbi:MAG: hypothetical protein ING19_21655 [Azospirillum sp.]|nr:hypothetical protein [Azospirillum sp.]
MKPKNVVFDVFLILPMDRPDPEYWRNVVAVSVCGDAKSSFHAAPSVSFCFERSAANPKEAVLGAIADLRRTIPGSRLAGLAGAPVESLTVRERFGEERFRDLVRIVEEGISGSETPPAFDPAVWLAEWALRPIPALGYRKPVNLRLDIREGEIVDPVGIVLRRMEMGVYS